MCFILFVRFPEFLSYLSLEDNLKQYLFRLKVIRRIPFPYLYKESDLHVSL